MKITLPEVAPDLPPLILDVPSLALSLRLCLASSEAVGCALPVLGLAGPSGAAGIAAATTGSSANAIIAFAAGTAMATRFASCSGIGFSGSGLST